MAKNDKNSHLGEMVRFALSYRGFVSIELYDDKYHARVGDFHSDEGIAKTPEKALEKALEWDQ